MSGPHGSPERAHVSADVLADLDEGLLDTDAAAAARRHLETCAACAGTEAALADLRRLLATDDPGPMPADVLTRIEAALGSADPRATSAVPGAPATPAVTLLPDRQGRPARPRAQRPPRWLSTAAAFVGVAAVGLAGVAGYQALSGGQSMTASTAGRASDSAGSAAAEGSPVLQVTRSGTDYTVANVEAAARRLSSDHFSAPAEKAPDATTPLTPLTSRDTGDTAALARLAGGPGLAACVALLTEGGESPLAVDLAKFDGRPAALVVLPTPDDAASVDAWVVGDGCGEGADAQVLYFRRVTR